MKVSEAIKILESKVVRSEENLKHFPKESQGYAANEARIIAYNIAINKLEQIDEPQAEKVEVPDFVAEWYESHENNLNQAIYDATIDSYDHRHKTEFEEWFIDSRNDTYGTLIRMKDGYTVKPKRWVVRHEAGKFFEKFTGNGTSRAWVVWKSQAYIFTDRAKAEAVAVLVEGSVEEVAE